MKTTQTTQSYINSKLEAVLSKLKDNKQHCLDMACSTKQKATAPSSSSVTDSISTLHSDIIKSHILTRLDGPTLASAACVSAQLSSLTSNQTLWTNICHSTWPSTNAPRLRHLISTFPPHGPRSFFSSSFTSPELTTAASLHHSRPSELISAVDVYHRNKLLLSKVVETETQSGWFMCSPFRVDLLDPKDTVATRIPYPDTDDVFRELAHDFTLSWVLIDPVGRRTMNLSSHKPLNVQRHWISGEVHVRFGTILSRGGPEEFMQCGIVVTCGGSHGGEMQVREVVLQVEDMDGRHLSGRESLEILQRGLEGKRHNVKGREVTGKKRYEEYMEVRRKRKERKLQREGRVDMLCVVLGVLIFSSIGLFIFWR